MHTIERVTEGFSLGEGPHWDASTQSLYFVDVFGQSIVKYAPTTKKVTKASVAPKTASFIIPVEGAKDQFVISLNNELVIILWDGESDSAKIVEKLASVDNKFNDAKCDSTGRLWAGGHTLNESDFMNSGPLGHLFSLDSNKQLKKCLDKIRVANGLAFNDKVKKMYYIDSLAGTVDWFDFDVNSGTISNRQVLFTLKKHNVTGIADGMTIDTDGNLWVAVFGGNRVLKIDGNKSETLLDTINMPAEQVTSVAFGGRNLDELFVTTGRFETDEKKLPAPVNGATYRVTGTGAKGLPGVSFKLN
ncbi:regucalcin [Tribolium castaneum]|uniref:Regucalcin n=1 Tax=Tribolium castaneum TaxID=7070 RepID=D6WJC8_TRICA|nr:PREDICTED: regucalcin [Tribolium castaneum]EFA03134.2 Regucalcin-like Protein [Tribolium castaneum]|eukprot:XP_967905.1 PREDICTED: regucalcin [Tribolium castaneum]